MKDIHRPVPEESTLSYPTGESKSQKNKQKNTPDACP